VGRGRRFALLAASVVVLVIDVGLVVARTGDDADPGVPAEDLLDAYRRSREVTFAEVRTFTRTAPDGRSLSYEERLVQVPPDDRLLIGGGAASGRLDGRVLRCSTDAAGASRCFEGDEASPWEEEVAAEVGNFEALVVGPDRLYDVEAGPEDGCFTLVLARDMLAPPYGDQAVFCFDEATGAPSRVEIHRPEAVDLVEATEIRTEVTPADLRPAELGDLVTG